MEFPRAEFMSSLHLTQLIYDRLLFRAMFSEVVVTIRHGERPALKVNSASTMIRSKHVMQIPDLSVGVEMHQ